MPSGSMRFMDWSSLQFHLIRIYEGPVFEHARRGRYTSDKVSCWLVRQGRVELTTGRNRVVAKPGEWAFVASPTRTQAFSADAEILSVYFHFAWPGDEPLFNRSINQVFPAERFPALEKSAMRLLQLMRRHMPRVDANLQFEKCSLDVYLRTQALLPDWMRAYVETMLQLKHTPQRLVGLDERALQLVRELDRHSLAEPFDEFRVASSIGLSAAHLAGLFLRDYGATPRRYLDRRRREAARHALEHTSASVKAVAFSLGFRYESHFCAWFKQAEHCTPSEFRGRAQGMPVG
jgi:AraC-like DNA-binding protein